MHVAQRVGVRRNRKLRTTKLNSHKTVHLSLSGLPRHAVLASKPKQAYSVQIEPGGKKPTWKQLKFWKDLGLYYWNGTKLYGRNFAASTKLLKRTLQGSKLSRREYRLLVTTTRDTYRLVPFALFVIIPAAELLLPFALKLFPNMLPSTFTTADETEAKQQKILNARFGLAKFMIDALKETQDKSTKADDFNEFIEMVKTSGEVSREEVYKFVTKFKDDITLDNLKRSQIQAMCKFLGVRPYGPTEFLRAWLRKKISKLVQDDKEIRQEGIHNLTLLELKQACADRGMDSMGTRKTLEALLEEWLELSLNLKVPIAMLILSRAFRLMSPAYQQSSDQLLKQSIAHLPEQILQTMDSEIEKPALEQAQTKQGKSDITGEVGSVEELAENSSNMLSKVEEIENAISQSVSPANFQAQKLQEIKTNLEEIIQNSSTSASTATAASSTTSNEKQTSQPSTIENQLKKMVKSLEEDINKVKTSSKPVLDLDNDGLLSTQELSVFLKKQLNFNDDEVKGFLERLDVDEDGYVPVQQLTNLRDLVVNEEKIREFMLQTNVKEVPKKT